MTDEKVPYKCGESKRQCVVKLFENKMFVYVQPPPSMELVRMIFQISFQRSTTERFSGVTQIVLKSISY